MLLSSVSSILRPGRFRRDPRQLEEEEEMWFNDDEYEEENGPNSNPSNTTASHSTTSPNNAIVSHSPSLSPSNISQSQQTLAGSPNSTTASVLANSSSPTGKIISPDIEKSATTELKYYAILLKPPFCIIDTFFARW